MFIIYIVYVNGREIKFSNTNNAFHNYWTYTTNLDEKNLEFNRLAVEAYKSSNKIKILETDYGFTEELLVYKDFIFSFISSNNHKLLFNYLPTKDLFIYNSFPNITKYHIEKINDIPDEERIGNIKITLYNGICLNYKIICTYDAFLNYYRVNEKEISLENVKELIYNDFLQSLINSKINTCSINSDFGLTTNTKNCNRAFNYIYFDKLMIITNYTEKVT